MALSFSRKQDYICLFLFIITIVASILSYRTSQKKWLLYREADNQFVTEKFNEAIPLYLESIKLGKTNPNITERLAASYVAVGNFSDAIRWYRTYLEIHPKDINARFALAQALSWNGNIKESEQEFRKVLENHEENN